MRRERSPFPRFRSGTYRIVASLPRYEDATVDQVLVDGEREMRLDIPLSLPRFAETVEIRADAPSKDDGNPAPPERLEIRQLDLLPLATDQFQDAFPLLPGVVRDPEGKLSFNGSRPSQSILLVNGTNVTDPVTGDFAIALPLKVIEEVEVNDIPYSAEYGRVTAAVAEVKTRGGTDEWDVDTGDLLPKPNLRDGTIKGLKTFVPQIAVSGPLKKGKLWLSQGLAYRFVRNRIHDVPTGDDERILESYDTFTQIDWKLAEEHQLTTTFSYFPLQAENLGLNALTSSEATPEFESLGWNGAISERSRLGEWVLESTVAMKEYNLSLRPKGDSISILTPDGLRQNYFDNLERDTGRVNLQTSATRSLPDLLGEHVLKVGGGLAHSRFHGIDRGLPIHVLDSSGRLLRRVDFEGDPAVEGRDLQASMFVQDRWRLGPRLGIEAGVRYDYDRLVAEHQFAPRIRDGRVSRSSRPHHPARGIRHLLRPYIPLCRWLRAPPEASGNELRSRWSAARASNRLRQPGLTRRSRNLHGASPGMSSSTGIFAEAFSCVWDIGSGTVRRRCSWTDWSRKTGARSSCPREERPEIVSSG